MYVSTENPAHTQAQEARAHERSSVIIVFPYRLLAN